MPNCKICNIYSGSGGNCTFISAGGANILIDAGKCYRTLKRELLSIGVEIESIDAIFITHEHRDHISAIRTLAHKHGTPIHMLLSSAEVYCGLKDEKLCEALMLKMKTDFELKINGLTVKAFPTSHDSRASVGYRLSFYENGAEYSIGYATDTGMITDGMRDGLRGCFAVLLESNHDTQMLMNGPYTFELKKRISSPLGHLSNIDAANFAAYLCKNGTTHIMLSHLSEENNLPSAALEACRSAVADDSVSIRAAEQDRPVWLYGNEPREELCRQ